MGRVLFFFFNVHSKREGSLHGSMPHIYVGSKYCSLGLAGLIGIDVFIYLRVCQFGHPK